MLCYVIYDNLCCMNNFYVSIQHCKIFHNMWYTWCIYIIHTVISLSIVLILVVSLHNMDKNWNCFTRPIYVFYSNKPLIISTIRFWILRMILSLMSLSIQKSKSAQRHLDRNLHKSFSHCLMLKNQFLSVHIMINYF